MPSNDQLKTSIAQAAEKLGIDAPDVSDQNNAQRAETLKELNAQIEAAEAEAKAEQEAVERAALEEKAEEDAAAAAELARLKAAEAKANAKPEKKPPFYVPEGKAVTAKGRRILSDGDEITADDLAGGQKALDAFVKSGHVATG